MTKAEQVVKAAYEGYATSTGGKTFDGRDMPKWEELPQRIVDAWRAAIIAAFTARDELFARPVGEEVIEIGATGALTEKTKALARYLHDEVKYCVTMKGEKPDFIVLHPDTAPELLSVAGVTVRRSTDCPPGEAELIKHAPDLLVPPPAGSPS